MNWIYIIDDNIVFGNAVTLRYDFFIKLMLIFLTGSLFLGLFLFNKTFFFILLFLAIGIVSLIPLHVFNGGIGTDLVFFLTVYTAYQFGFWWAFVLSKILNVSVLIAENEFQLSIFYDIASLTGIAFIASMITNPAVLVPATLIMLIAYHIGYNLYNRYLGVDHGLSYLWSGTHLFINLFLVTQILPILP